MIDSVLKGNGNSRFLKSAVPAGTSWADALAMLQAGTFPIDFNGINTEGFQQVGTPLNKANLLKDMTALTLGLTGDAVPNDMFNALAHAGDLHVWRKTVVNQQPVPAGYTLGKKAEVRLASQSVAYGTGTDTKVTVSVTGSISVSDSGVIIPGTITQYTTYPDAISGTLSNSVIAGKFIFVSAVGSYIRLEDVALRDIYYAPPNATMSSLTEAERRYLVINGLQKVTGYPATPAGTITTYPVSTNRNAYQEGDDAKPAGYTLGEVVKSTGAYGFFGMMGFAYGTSYFQKISDAIKVADDGSVSHVAPVGDISDSTVLDSASVLKERIAGKYITLSENSYTKQPYTNELPPTNVVLYIPADVNVKMIHPEDASLSNQYALFFDRYQPVTGYAAIPANTTIEYLGCLGDKARVQVVSYVGTGTYGENNPTVIYFDFPPKVFLIGTTASSGGYGNAAVAGCGWISTAQFESTSAQPYRIGFEGKKVSIYSSSGSYYSSPLTAYNQTGWTYIAVALG